MEVVYLKTGHLRNGEHIQFYNSLDKLIITTGVTVLGIDALYAEFKPLLTDEEEAFNIVKESAITDVIVDADILRDNTFRGLVKALKSNLTHFNPVVKKASLNLMPVFNLLGNITKEAYDEETALIRDLCKKLLGELLADTTAAGLKEWVVELQKNNDDFEELMNSRFTEGSVKTQLRMKQVRLQIDKVYLQIIKRINALIIVNGEIVYKDFVNELNQRIESYNQNLAQRKGRNAKADEDTDQQV